MKKYLIAILLFGLMSSTPGKNGDATNSRLSKTEEYLYNGSTFFKTVESYYYHRDKLDSIVNILTDNSHEDWSTKETYTFHYHSDTVEVYIKGRYYPASTKIRQYEYNSNGKLSRLLMYGNNRIASEQTYTYDPQNKTIKVSEIERREIDDNEKRKEFIYFLNNSTNIDSTYEYIYRNQQREIYSKRVFNYDTGPNPYRYQYYSMGHEFYFNSNNCVSSQFLDSNHDNKVHKESFKYDNNFRLAKNFDDQIYESDSIVKIFHYQDKQ